MQPFTVKKCPIQEQGHCNHSWEGHLDNSVRGGISLSRGKCELFGEDLYRPFPTIHQTDSAISTIGLNVPAGNLSIEIREEDRPLKLLQVGQVPHFSQEPHNLKF